MSGHNKWSKIKHKKAASDSARSKIFSKYSKLIAVEAKKAGGDPTSPGLKAVIERARKENMPNDNIERAIKKATDADTAAMEEVIYEAYGAGGAALIIVGLTDNRNRTAAEVKSTLTKAGSSLAGAGAASWAFTRTDGGEWTTDQPLEVSESDAEKIASLMESLEELDDIQAVYTNVPFTDQEEE